MNILVIILQRPAISNSNGINVVHNVLHDKGVEGVPIWHVNVDLESPAFVRCPCARGIETSVLG